VTQDLRQFGRLSNLQACKLQHEGDHAGAWTWLRASLRSGRHSGMNGFIIEGLVGNAIYGMTSSQAMKWAENPKVDARLLRQALDDVLAMERLDRSPSHMVRSEYFGTLNSLRDFETSERMLIMAGQDQPSWRARISSRLERFAGVLTHEPERSRRVSRLILANWLSACDLPQAERKKRSVTFGKLTLYEPAPGETTPLPPAELARWYETTRYSKAFLSDWKTVENNALLRDERNRAALIVCLATELYKREKGKEPARVEDLVGPYLKSIPDGYAAPADDPTAKGMPR
jgi:hypothetical protein